MISCRVNAARYRAILIATMHLDGPLPDLPTWQNDCDDDLSQSPSMPDAPHDYGTYTQFGAAFERSDGNVSGSICWLKSGTYNIGHLEINFKG